MSRWIRHLRRKVSTRRHRTVAVERLESRLVLYALPTSTVAWEAIPNVIRTDGIERFHIEIEVPRPVTSVTIDLFGAAPLKPTNRGIVTLLDDGQGNDRVAADGIYTSPDFWFDTTKQFWPLSTNSPDSPATLGFTDVGDVYVTETDGSISQLLQRAQVGLLRSDVPEATITSVTSDVLMTEHLINVSTEYRDTQRSLRGGSNYGGDLRRLSNAVYDLFPDAFDQMMLFSTNRVEIQPRLSSGNFHAGVHNYVKVDYEGNALEPFDHTASYGSAGKLQAINVLDAYNRGIWGANATHELVHQWSAYVGDLPIGNGGHYHGRSSVGSMVGGYKWEPNGDGSFTVNGDEGASGAHHASPLDLYMMGLIDASQVPDMYVARSDMTYLPHLNPVIQPSDIVATVKISDIIARFGQRVPGPSTAQRDFNLGFIAESHNRVLTPTEMTFYEILADHYTKDVPAGAPDPYVGDGWSSIDRFFGNGTTWSSLVPQPDALLVDILDVTPDPRSDAVSEVTIRFSQRIDQLELADLSLTREGGPSLLGAGQTLATQDNITWTLGNLTGLTGAVGQYRLALDGPNSGIRRSSDGRLLDASAADAWFVAPELTLALDQTSLAESGQTAVLSANLSRPSTRDVTLQFGFSGTANFDPRYTYYPTDYLRSATTIVIPAGATSGSISISSLSDPYHEEDQTINVALLSASNVLVRGASQFAAVIVDDDPDPVIVFNSGASQTPEGGEATVLISVTPMTELRITAGLTFGGAALRGSDYTSPADQLVIQPMTNSAVLRMPVLKDNLDEPNERIDVTIVSVENATLSGKSTAGTWIVDGDPPPTVALSVGQSEIQESGSGTQLTATLSAVSGFDVVVDLGFAGVALRGTDYSSPAQITVPAGSSSASVSLAPLDDGDDEPGESIGVEIVSVTNGTELDQQSVTATLVDDDFPKVSLAIDKSTIGETNEVAVVTASLPNPAYDVVFVRLAFSGSATRDTDYGVSAQTIVIPIGSSSATMDITALNDSVDELGETILVDIESITNGVESGTQQVSTTILDDDLLAVSLNVDQAEIAEAGGVATVTASVNSPPAEEIRVLLSISGTAASSDFAASATEIVIPAGSRSGSLTITASQDTADEAAESVVIEITSVTNGLENGSQQVTTTIHDDDLPTVSLSLDKSNIAESGGVATLVATLSNQAYETATIELDWSGTAERDVDYGLNAVRLIIPVGSISAAMTITGLSDSATELDETVVVDLSTATNAVEAGLQRVTTTIVDDDPPNVSLTIDQSTMNEKGGAAKVIASLSAATSKTVTIDLSLSGTATAGTDYSSSSNQIVIAAGETSGSVDLVTLDDASDETDETIVVDIAGVTNGSEAGVQQVETMIVDDDEFLGASFDFGTATSPVAAGYVRVTNQSTYNSAAGWGWSAGVITALDQGTGSDLTRDLNATADGTFSVDVPNGNYQVVATIGDARTKRDKMAVILEGSPVDNLTTNAGQFLNRTYQVTVSDGQLTFRLDDQGGRDGLAVINALVVSRVQPALTVSLSAASIAENAGSAAATGTVTRSGSTAAAVTVTLDSSDTSEATVPATVTIPAGSASASFVIAAVDDGLTDGSQAVSITARASGHHSGSQSLTVTDDETPPSFPGLKLDFGTATSPLAAGFVRATHTTLYSAAVGYGWLNGTVSSIDRGSGGALERDFVYTPAATWGVDVPNGTYSVRFTVGDVSSKHDNMGFFLEGSQVANITTGQGGFSVQTFQVVVSDGQLTVWLRDLGGRDANVVLNGLEIASVSGSPVMAASSGGSGAEGEADSGSSSSSGSSSMDPMAMSVAPGIGASAASGTDSKENYSCDWIWQEVGENKDSILELSLPGLE